MSSNINTAIPPFGNPTTAGVRANFSAAKTEIEALQTAFGFANIADTATSTTPLALTINTWRKLNNNGLGAATKVDRYPSGVTSLWNTSTNQFDFTDLPINTTIFLRTDLLLTTGGNNLVCDLALFLGIGSASAYQQQMATQSYFKSAGEHSFVAFNGFYIDSNDVRNNPAELRIRLDGAGSCVVNGFYLNIILPTGD
jgi:hypothetical protein